MAPKGFLRVLSQNVVTKLLPRTCVLPRNSVKGLKVLVRVCLPTDCCDLPGITQIIPQRVLGLLLACRGLTRFTAENSNSATKRFNKDEKAQVLKAVISEERLLPKVSCKSHWKLYLFVLPSVI